MIAFAGNKQFEQRGVEGNTIVGRGEDPCTVVLTVGETVSVVSL
jgi:hypothetical protein